ncbi:uncharacterized protein METZ01_LOCUS509296, partial [marine metagenome]
MIRPQILHIIGILLIMLGFSMSFSLGWSIYYAESDFISILQALITTIISGSFLFFTFKSNNKVELSTRDGFAIVTLGWLAMVIFSALPFYFSGTLSYTNSFFEAMSGMTTTGATVLGQYTTLNVEDMPHGLLFWRSFTQFIG